MKDFPWYNKYPAGIPREIGPLEYQSLVELFEVSTKRFKDRIAFENMGKELSFHEIGTLSTAFAHFFCSRRKLHSNHKKSPLDFTQRADAVEEGFEPSRGS